MLCHFVWSHYWACVCGFRTRKLTWTSRWTGWDRTPQRRRSRTAWPALSTCSIRSDTRTSMLVTFIEAYIEFSSFSQPWIALEMLRQVHLASPNWPLKMLYQVWLFCPYWCLKMPSIWKTCTLCDYVERIFWQCFKNRSNHKLKYFNNKSDFPCYLWHVSGMR